jgi:hypothetical protein
MVKRTAVLVLALFAVWYGVTAHTAELSARIDRPTVALNESFTLLIEAVGDVEGVPDFGPLDADFEVRVQSQSQNIQIIQGQYSRAHQWQLTLFPRRVGQLDIPELSIGNDRTPALSIRVTEPGAAGENDDPGNLVLEVDVLPETAYVQSQLVYRVRLYRSAETRLGRVEDPVIETGEAIVSPMGDSRTFQTTRGGRRFDVVERRYLVSPQSSGPLVFAPLDAEAVVIEPLGLGGRHQRLTSEAVTLDVKPVPDGFQGDWLPARSVRLFQEWGREPDTLRAGEPITRTVTLVADGLIAAQLPNIGAGTTAGLKQYPDQPVLSNQDGGDAVVGIRQESAAIIPTVAGTYQLPSVEVGWFNVETGRTEMAVLPAHTLTVLPGPVVDTAAPPTFPATAADAPAADPLRSPWAWLAVIALIGWAVTGALWWHRTRDPISTADQGTKGPGLPADASMARRIRSLRSACAANDPRQARQILLEWSRQLGLSAPGLAQLADRLKGEAGEEILWLDRSLYSRTAEPWDGAGLARHADRVFAVQPPSSIQRRDSLPPLYPAGERAG